MLIAGFGRFGQMVGRVLRARHIRFTALEISQAQVDFLRRFGNRLHYGDASRLEVLRSAGAGEAELLVLAIDDVEASVRTAGLVRRHFPRLRILARARNRQHAFRLMDAGVTEIWRETFASSLELAEAALVALGTGREIVPAPKQVQDEMPAHVAKLGNLFVHHAFWPAMLRKAARDCPGFDS